MIVVIVSVLSVGIWGYLLLARGGFWRCHERDDALLSSLRKTKADDAQRVWASVVAVVPARDEAGANLRRGRTALRPGYCWVPSGALVVHRKFGATPTSSFA